MVRAVSVHEDHIVHATGRLFTVIPTAIPIPVDALVFEQVPLPEFTKAPVVDAHHFQAAMPADVGAGIHSDGVAIAP